MYKLANPSIIWAYLKVGVGTWILLTSFVQTVMSGTVDTTWYWRLFEWVALVGSASMVKDGLAKREQNK